MSYLNVTKGPQANLANTEVKDGALRVAVDEHRVYLDFKDAGRIEISDFVKGMTTSEIKDQLAPLPKFYLASDTNHIWYFGDDWVDITDLVVSSADKASKDADGNVITETYAPINSPTLLGNPTAPTVSNLNDRSTQLATDEFVNAAIADHGHPQIDIIGESQNASTVEINRSFNVITGITLDNYGHVLGFNTAAITIHQADSTWENAEAVPWNNAGSGEIIESTDTWLDAVESSNASTTSSNSSTSTDDSWNDAV